MAYEASIHLDSLSPRNHRLTTAVIAYPRVVLAEVHTHRRLSRDSEPDWDVWLPECQATRELSKSSASSRAIPVSKMIQAVTDDPYVPARWSKAGPGMQEAGWLEGADAERAKAAWLRIRDACVTGVRELLDCGVHKQDANRALEPFAWVTQVVTGTADGWANFFALRTDRRAHPAFRKVARMLYKAYRASTPTRLRYGQWHLPFLTVEEVAAANDGKAGFDDGLEWRRVSAARTARVSFLNHEARRPGRDEDLKLFQKMMGESPRHAAPSEHQGTPDEGFTQGGLCGNFTGWVQFRKMIAEEFITSFDPTPEQVAAWDGEE